MQILLLNPNTSQAMTDTMTAIAREAVAGEAEIRSITATKGFPYIASRAEAQVSGTIALEAIAENLDGVDAVVIAAFGDPGLTAAKEIFDIPVIGMAEASMMSAAMVGERFSIVTFSPIMLRWYRDCVAHSGLTGRCAGLHTLREHPSNVTNVGSVFKSELAELARQVVQNDGSDVIIFAGAPLAGLALELAGEIPALVIDPISVAVMQAAAFARLLPRDGFGRRKHKPLSKSSVGINPALASAVYREAR